jgi:hypothetical protein
MWLAAITVVAASDIISVIASVGQPARKTSSVLSSTQDLHCFFVISICT